MVERRPRQAEPLWSACNVDDAERNRRSEQIKPYRRDADEWLALRSQSRRVWTMVVCW